MTRSANVPETVSTTHTAFVAAPPHVVYELVADVNRWPYMFEPTVHVERLYRGATDERLRLWAVSNGAIRSWISRRFLDRDELRIRFRQEMPVPPLASMAGEWVFIPLPGNVTSVVLLHEFRAVDDDPDNLALIAQAVDRTSTAELAALRRIAELGEQRLSLVHSFADSVTIDSDPGPVYDFLYRAQDWPLRLTDVSRVVVDEAVPNLQTIEMDSLAGDGTSHTTHQVRVCFPYESIVYKHTVPPAMFAVHVGRWRVYPIARGVRVTSHQTVLIRPQVVGQMLGRDATLEYAQQLVRRTLSRHSMLTMTQAKQAIEGCPDVYPEDIVAPRTPIEADNVYPLWTTPVD